MSLLAMLFCDSAFMYLLKSNNLWYILLYNCIFSDCCYSN